jgi:hypothetical protein
MEMRYLTNRKDKIVFFCDGCGKRLDDADPGEPYWEDYDRFLETMHGPDAEPTLFLCERCFKKRGGLEQGWCDPRRKEIARTQEIEDE